MLADKQIVSTRVLAAPRGRVFRAWTEPDHLTRWWGPKGFTSTFEEFVPRPGGEWHFVLHGPNGADYKNKSVFVEVVKPERIVFQHVEMLFETAAECEKVKKYAIEANEQNLDRLEAELARMA